MSVGNVSKLTVEEHFSNFVGIYAATKTRKGGITSIVKSGHRTDYLHSGLYSTITCLFVCFN